MNQRIVGTLSDGRTVTSRTLVNRLGMEVEIMTWGGTIRRIIAPDRAGRLAQVTLGFDHLEPYLARHPYFGSMVGRIAGRVSDGRIQVAGRSWQLACNNGRNHLHGGANGLDRQSWLLGDVPGADPTRALRLSYRSPDGEEGYPGTVDITIDCQLDDDGSLHLRYSAESDTVTPLSLTNHAYFNLAGEGRCSVAEQRIAIQADARVPAAADGTLSGRLEPVAGTPADLRRGCTFAEAIARIEHGHGDLYRLRPTPLAMPQLAARAEDPASGRVLEVLTTEPWLQFYSGIGLDGTLYGPSGFPYGPYAGFCLEAERYPDGCAEPLLSDLLIAPGRPYLQHTIYRFSTT